MVLQTIDNSSILLGTTRMFLFIWWFAVISNSGQLAIFEYVKQSSCEIMQSNYKKTGMKVTDCTFKEES